MATVAVIIPREVAIAILQNFSVNELVIETCRDIFARLKQKFVQKVFAESSLFSQISEMAVPSGSGKTNNCTSAGIVRQSLSFGRTDNRAFDQKDSLPANVRLIIRILMKRRYNYRRHFEKNKNIEVK